MKQTPLFWKITKNWIQAIFLFAAIYGFLAICNWKFNPAEWGGFSKFLLACGEFTVFWSVISSDRDIARDHRRVKEDEAKKQAKNEFR